MIFSFTVRRCWSGDQGMSSAHSRITMHLVPKRSSLENRQGPSLTWKDTPVKQKLKSWSNNSSYWSDVVVIRINDDNSHTPIVSFISKKSIYPVNFIETWPQLWRHDTGSQKRQQSVVFPHPGSTMWPESFSHQFPTQTFTFGVLCRNIVWNNVSTAVRSVTLNLAKLI